MELYTCRVADKALCQTRRITFLDTTVKSGVLAFAPTWEMVWSIKNTYNAPQAVRAAAQEAYTQAYQVAMQASQKTHKPAWDALKKYTRLAIACYCPDGQFCHRHLFADILEDYLWTEHEIQADLQGEVGTLFKAP